MYILMMSYSELLEVQESTHFNFVTVRISFIVIPFCGVIDSVFKWSL